jgi:hypothetical protein
MQTLPNTRKLLNKRPVGEGMQQSNLPRLPVITVLFLLFTMAYSGCQKPTIVKEGVKMDVVGKWHTPTDLDKTLDSEYGPARIQLDFREAGTVSVRFEVSDSPGGSVQTDDEQPYQINNGVFVSDAIDRGEAVAIKLDGDRLVFQLQNREVYDFARTPEGLPGDSR